MFGVWPFNLAWFELVCQIWGMWTFCCGVLGVMVIPTGRELVTKVVGFCGYLGLWHDFVFFEPACVATESEIEGRTCSSFKEKVEVFQICMKKLPYSRLPKLV